MKVHILACRLTLPHRHPSRQFLTAAIFAICYHQIYFGSFHAWRGCPFQQQVHTSHCSTHPCEPILTFPALPICNLVCRERDAFTLNERIHFHCVSAGMCFLSMPALGQLQTRTQERFYPDPASPPPPCSLSLHRQGFLLPGGEVLCKSAQRTRLDSEIAEHLDCARALASFPPTPRSGNSAQHVRPVHASGIASYLCKCDEENPAQQAFCRLCCCGYM